jgi:hypothetical protein
MNAQTLYVSQGPGIVHGVEHPGSHPLGAIAPALRVWKAEVLFSRPNLGETGTPVRMLALDVSSAANQETIL